MNVVRVALGVIQDRGKNTVDPGIVAFGAEEADFLVRHVKSVRKVSDAAPRSRFTAGSRIPYEFEDLRRVDDDEFEIVAKYLQSRLAGTMATSTNASDCVFAVVHTKEESSVDGELTLLKLDAVVEAARISLAAGRVTLTVLKKLLPEPGRLQKAISWPDTRSNSDAISVDSNAKAARYFENAFDLQVSPKPVAAESQLAISLITRLPPDRVPEAFRAASALAGPLDEVLTELVQQGYTELEEDAQLLTEEQRPTGIVRVNKIAAKPIIWTADGIELKVPSERAGAVDIRESDSTHEWIITITTQSKPQIGG